MLGTVREQFTVVRSDGVPVEPKELAKGYGIQIGCIVRDTVSINTGNLRTEANAHLVNMLLMKLHARYLFPPPYNNTDPKGNKVNYEALKKMSCYLSSWRTRVHKRIKNKESFDEIRKHEPMLDEAEFKIFKAKCASDEAKRMTEWGKKMRELNIGNHHCGSGGYRGVQATWDKEDAELLALGKENPWHKFTDLQVRNFVRACYYLDPKTKEFVTDDLEVKKFEKLLVRNSPWILCRLCFT